MRNDAAYTIIEQSLRRAASSSMRKTPLNRQRGMTLIEIIIALGIMGTVVAGLAAVADSYGNNMRTSIVGQQTATFALGMQKYVDDNYASLAAVATATTPAIVTVSTLNGAGTSYLPAGFTHKNSYGQSVCGLVVQPTAGKLQAIVVTEGGTAINDVDLGQIAGVIGANGGGIYSSEPTTMRGTMGGWATPIGNYANANNAGTGCDGSPGAVNLRVGHPVVALWFQGGDKTAGVLYRNAIPGQPQLNQMNTPIVMASVHTIGTACSATGAIAQDGTGLILSCQAGLWTPSGDGKCIYSTADLNSMQDDGRCFNSAGSANSPAGAEWIFLEVYRHPDKNTFYTAQRVVGMTGAAAGRVWQRNQQSGASGTGWGAWIQQADSQVSISAGGNVTAAGAITGAQLTATNAMYSYGTICSQNSSLDCTGTGGTVINGAQLNTGTITTTGSITANVDDWGLALNNGAGTGNVQRQSSTGSANVNDLYIRSIGKWASQIDGGIKSYADFSWSRGMGRYSTNLPYSKWNCAVTQVGGKWSGGSENIQVIRDGASGNWIVDGSSRSDNSGAFARITCAQL